MVRHNILLVDNELLSRDLLTNHLKHQGFKVFAAESCEEAIKLIPQQRPRLAIISSRFAEKAITDLISRLRSVSKDVLVFQLCQQPGSHAAENLERQGFHDIIVKPFRLEEVGVKLKHAVELVNLRQALRNCAESKQQLETELKKFKTVEEEVKIPDLSGLELETPASKMQDIRTAGVSAEDSRNDREEAAADTIAVQQRRAAEDLIEKIRRLDQLCKDGILTDSEFTAKKKELLKRI